MEWLADIDRCITPGGMEINMTFNVSNAACMILKIVSQ